MFNIIQASNTHLIQASFLFDQYREFYNMPSDFEACKRFIKQRLTRQDSLIYLAIRKGSVIGFMQIYATFSSVAMQPTWVLNDLFVAPAARRLGCARSMMIYLQKEAKQRKIFSIKLATATDNRYAKSLYHSLDYQLNNRFEHYSLRII